MSGASSEVICFLLRGDFSQTRGLDEECRHCKRAIGLHPPGFTERGGQSTAPPPPAANAPSIVRASHSERKASFSQAKVAEQNQAFERKRTIDEAKAKTKVDEINAKKAKKASEKAPTYFSNRYINTVTTSSRCFILAFCTSSCKTYFCFCIAII